MNIPTIHEVLESLGSKERYDTYFGNTELWQKQHQKFVNKEESNSGTEVPRRRAEDSEAEEDAETAFQRIKRQATERT